MPHKVEISDKTYEDLKEFCNLNDLKMGQFADKLIRDGLMMEMYGDVPFTNYRKPQEIESVPVPDYSLVVPKEEVEAVAMDPPSGLPVGGVFEVIDKETKAHMNETMEAVDEHLNEIVGFKWEGAGGPDIILTRRELPEMRAARKKADEADTSAEENHVNFLNVPPVQEVYIKEKEKLEEKILEEVGVPKKVMNRITRRRLK